MTDLSPARERPAWRWLPNVALGAAVALGLTTMALASLPKAPSARAVAQQTAPGPATRAEDPPLLIAFGEPVPGRPVVSPFGLRRLPWEDNGRLHAGVDISGDPGEPVRAAADGVVVDAGRNSTYGQFVAVRHAEGLLSFYAHLGHIQARIAPGVALKAGEAVGQVGSTGVSTGPHLHFEIRDRRDRPLNPSYFIGKAFAEADDLPLRRAQRFGGRVRMAEVSIIPRNKKALMLAKLEREAAEKADEQAKLQAQKLKPGGGEPKLRTPPATAAGGATPAGQIEGLKLLSIDPSGRPHAKLTL